jgi:hypothetical integral membrane protein (TIGR02206 family)
LEAFFRPNLNIPPELVFKYLSPPHWIYIGGWAFITAALCLLMRRKPPEAKTRCLKALVFTIIVSEAARIIWGVYYGVFMWQDWLPLHLCAIIVFLGPIIIYTRSDALRYLLTSFVYGVSMPAAVFALLTPNKPVLTPFCFEFFQTMYTHGAIICLGVYLLTVMGHRPRLRVLPKLLGMTLAWMGVCFCVNQLINWLDPQEIPWSANYMFLTFAPKDTPLEAFEQWLGPFYMAPTVGVLFLIWVALYLPWEIAARRKASKV